MAILNEFIEILSKIKKKIKCDVRNFNLGLGLLIKN